MRLLVLVERDVWPSFHESIARVGREWQAPSGRRYALELAGRRLEVWLEQGDLEPPPPGEEIDIDLFALTGQIYDAVGGDWSQEALGGIAELWGWAPSSPR